VSRPVKNIRCGKTPAKMALGSKTEKVGSPDSNTGRENLGAGKYLDKGKAMFEGPSQIFKDNRRG
jgi:hypothetical protein